MARGRPRKNRDSGKKKNGPGSALVGRKTKSLDEGMGVEPLAVSDTKISEEERLAEDLEVEEHATMEFLNGMHQVSEIVEQGMD